MKSEDIEFRFNAGDYVKFYNIKTNNYKQIDDNFVELGGNSLSAMKLQMILNERLGVNLSSSEIIEIATPINIANHIKFNLDVYSTISINYSFDELCPLSESQLNVYLDETVNEMGTAYNNPFKIEFNKDYSVDEIKNAIYKLLEIYPVLSVKIWLPIWKMF